jgi:4'-phosphopantetheinyl transferase
MIAAVAKVRYKIRGTPGPKPVSGAIPASTTAANSKVISMKVIPKIRHWLPVTHPPTLPSGGLHLWRIPTRGKGAPLAKLRTLLSPRESERADRLRFDHHRERYVRAHAGLRMILSKYININPQHIVYSYLRAGKPRLDGAVSNFEFNLTTTADLALVGLSLDKPIGVDCEQVRDRENLLAIAKRMFTREAASRIAASALEEQVEQFHVSWTSLEAEVKADGRGLAGRKRPLAPHTLQIGHCIPEPGFIAAVARKDLPPVEDWVTLELTAS